MPEARFGEVAIDGDRIRLLVDCRLTPAAAEAIARQLYLLAGQLREGGPRG